MSLLQNGAEDLSSLFALSIAFQVSRCGVSGAAHVIGSAKTGVIGVGKYGDAKPPGTWCLGV